MNIVDGDTFDVSTKWEWNGKTGSRVRPAGYNAPEMNAPGGPEAKDKLEKLISGCQVELVNYRKIDRGRLVCDVLFKGKNLADYFRG